MFPGILPFALLTEVPLKNPAIREVSEVVGEFEILLKYEIAELPVQQATAESGDAEDDQPVPSPDFDDEGDTAKVSAMPTVLSDVFPPELLHVGERGADSRVLPSPPDPFGVAMVVRHHTSQPRLDDPGHVPKMPDMPPQEMPDLREASAVPRPDFSTYPDASESVLPERRDFDTPRIGTEVGHSIPVNSARADRPHHVEGLLPVNAISTKPRAIPDALAATSEREMVTSSDPAPSTTPTQAQAQAGLLIERDQSSDLTPEITVHSSKDVRTEAPSHAPSQPAPRQIQSNPHDVLRQISDKLTQDDQAHVEITLTPEELGKVRLVITPGDAPTVAVYADNRETLDLLRRNADLLGKELRDTGMAGATLSFGDSDRSGQRGHNAVPSARLGEGGADTTQAQPNAARQLGRQIYMRM
ncbi:flagellar hook-length control protein FliK [Paracoccus laeviglucosivorans]|uniref:Hook-length control protein FliK n=1 Tax=Paracoccus laeviglucosivorans TaxID=1197861 RepID=A0A521F777_9RHOB|nr:flagellar hook-length control protein FliK [Paracoccus laeviglucosivorans]SMO92055.1 hook-length control protein FliK [Paracoccus laeviglucosivorans]